GVRGGAWDAPAAYDRRGRNENPGKQAAGHTCPGLGAMNRMVFERGRDGERGDRQRPDQEAATEEEIEPAPLDRVANACEQGDDRAREGHDGLQDQSELGQGELRLEVMTGDEERQGSAEQAEQEDLAPQPGL